MEVTILIPMAGMGSRFSDVGFLQPKPVIDVGGKPMIMWVVENILPRCLDLKARIVVVIRRDQEKLERVAVQLRQMVPNLEVVYADALTEGAACTCLLAREHICNARPLLIINSDQYIDWNDAGDSSAFWQQIAREAAQGYDANILCFKRPMELGDTKWSYAATDADGFVSAVREKEVISDGVPADLTDFISCHLRQRSMDHTASILGCSLQDLGHLSPLLPGALAHAVGDGRMGHDCREPHAAPTGPHAPSLCAPFHSPLYSAHASSHASEDGRGGGGEELLVLLEALRNMQRVKFIACENEPRLIEAAISDGFDVKVCVQYVEAADDNLFQDSAAPQGEALATDRCRRAGRYLLGGDGALHEVSLGLLQRLGASLWVECQDTATLCHFASMNQFQSFARTKEEVVLTSQKKLWAPFPHAFKAPYGQDTVAVLPPGADAVPLLGQAVGASSSSCSIWMAYL